MACVHVFLFLPSNGQVVSEEGCGNFTHSKRLLRSRLDLGGLVSLFICVYIFSSFSLVRPYVHNSLMCSD
jgi:hypothetical protein